MNLIDPAERVARGVATYEAVTGSAPAVPGTLLEESWRDFVYAEIWSRTELDRRARYLISLAGAASSNGPVSALESYAFGALATGEISLAELREAALHLAVYAGWQRGAELDTAVTLTAEKLGLEPVKLDPICGAPRDPDERIATGIAEFDRVMTFPGPPPVSPYFAVGIDGFVFAEMWCRPGLDQRSRRWITLVGVCDSAAETPINSHIHAAMASGNCRPEELHEFVLQYAVHAGWPKASVVQGAVFAMAKKVADGKPFNG